MRLAGTIYAEVENYLRKMQPLIDLWSHITRQAVNEMTTMPMRAMMGAHIEHLQSLYRGALELPVPAPCQRAHTAFLNAVGTSIDAYLATAEARRDEETHATFLSALRAYGDWRAEVARLSPELN